MKSRIPTWIFGVLSGLCAATTAYVFLSAVTTASLRFGHCGATSLDAPEQYCRIGMKLLYLSYGLGGLTLVLVGLTFWLFHRRRKNAWPLTHPPS